jgi:hypothetical protein
VLGLQPLPSLLLHLFAPSLPLPAPQPATPATQALPLSAAAAASAAVISPQQHHHKQQKPHMQYLFHHHHQQNQQ